MDPVAWTLAQPAFSALPDALRSVVATHLEVVHVAVGEWVLRAGGDPSSHLSIIRKGDATLSLAGDVRLRLEVGDWFGFPSLLSGESPAFDVVASDDLLLYRLPSDAARRLLGHHSVASAITAGLADRLRHGQPTIGAGMRMPIASVMTRDPIAAVADATLAEAAQAMERHSVTSVLVRGRMWRIVSDRDLRRGLAARLGPDAPLRLLDLAPAPQLPPDASTYDAMMLLLERGVDHLLVVRGDTILGLVSRGDLLRQTARSPLHLRRRLADGDPEALTGFAARVTDTVVAQRADGVAPLAIARTCSILTDTLTRALITRATNQLGPAPAPYAWLTLGSAARREQQLLTDQDHALVHGDCDVDGQAWFASLAQRVTDGMVAAGIPPCPGGSMATRWTGDLDVWTARFQQWMTIPSQDALYRASVFFDFRVSAGDLDVGVLDDLVAEGRHQRVFLARLAASAATARPAIGWFHRLRPDERGRVDLKAGGILPLVELARLLAIEAGSHSRGTVERLQDAAAAGLLSEPLADTLREGLSFLLRLRLDHQVEQIGIGAAPDSEVAAELLSATDRRDLKEVLAELVAARRATFDRLGIRDIAP